MARAYVIRKFKSGNNSSGKPFYNYSLTIPAGYAEQLPEGMKYACEILPEITFPDTEDVPLEYRGRTVKGILFMPHDGTVEKPPMPDWASKSDNGAPPKPRRARPGKSPA